MTQASLVRSGTGTKPDYVGHGTDTSPRGSIAVTRIQYMTRRLLKCHGSHKGAWRHKIAGYLTNVRNATRCIDELLLICTTEGGPDGLDTAIDILARTGNLVLDYAWLYFQHDVAIRSPSTDRAYKPNDDYWYILLRAVGRTDVAAADRFRFIVFCANAEFLGIRESVVEGLRDLGTPAAKTRLMAFAATDKDEYVREMAKEALADLEN